MKKTNLAEIKANTKALARCVKVEPLDCVGGELMTNHPFTDSVFWDKKWFELMQKYPDNEDIRNINESNISSDLVKSIDLKNEDTYNEWLKEFDKKVDKIDKLALLYHLYRTPYKLLFVKFNEYALSEKDLAEYMADAWVTEENPNMDCNVSREESLEIFKKCNKKHLMTEEDYEYYKNLPEEITVWRGVGKGRIKLGLSWTDNQDKAEWFMNRWKARKDGESMMLRATVKKENVIAYFNTRGEQEILLDVFACEKKIERIL